MFQWRPLIRELLTTQFDLFLAVLIVLFGLLLAVATWRLVGRLLGGVGVPETVEGTPFERTAQRLGTSTVALLAQLSSLFVFGLAAVLSMRIAGFLDAGVFASRISNFVPQLFVAIVVLITGVIAGEKAALIISERLSGMKVSGVDAVPEAAKYTIFYVGAIVALDQVGVATTALVVLLGAYVVGAIAIGIVAFRHLLTSAAAGIYLLLNEPYSIGDQVEIDGRTGIVQEVDLFVTRIEEEDEGTEHVVPNHQVLAAGVARNVE